MALADREAILEYIAQDNGTAAIELDEEFEAKAEVARQRPIPPKPATAPAALFDVTPSARTTASPASDDRSNSYRPLFEKIRAHCAANGPTDDTARGFCERFPEEFKLSRANLTHPANARGFAQVIEAHRGVFGGVRFTKLPTVPPRHGRGAAVTLYRAEVA
jgi:hypothetical protein